MMVTFPYNLLLKFACACICMQCSLPHISASYQFYLGFTNLDVSKNSPTSIPSPNCDTMINISELNSTQKTKLSLCKTKIQRFVCSSSYLSYQDWEWNWNYSTVFPWRFQNILCLRTFLSRNCWKEKQNLLVCARFWHNSLFLMR